VISPPRVGDRGGVIVRDLFRHMMSRYDYVIGKIAKVDQEPKLVGDKDNFELVPYRDPVPGAGVRAEGDDPD
jgi:hypothetical protein